IDPRTRIPRNNILLVGVVALAGALLVDYQLGAELLNFGAFVGFMWLNLAAFRRYYLRAEKKTVVYLVFPLLGFGVCLYIWLSLRTPAKVAGFIWLTVGLAYGSWKTALFTRNLPFAEPAPEEEEGPRERFNS